MYRSSFPRTTSASSARRWRARPRRPTSTWRSSSATIHPGAWSRRNAAAWRAFAMCRREGFSPEAAGIFTWLGKSYHCLADVALWLRVLARGRGYYDASPLSDYRMHPGQEQRTVAMGIACITERFEVVQAARTLG